MRELFDFYCYGGIYRGIEIHEMPERSLDRAQVTTTALDRGEVRVKVLFHGVADGEKVELSYRFDDESEKVVSLEVSGGCAEFAAVLADKSVWSCESPNLHTLTIKIAGDEIVERFGLRTVKAEKGKILLK